MPASEAMRRNWHLYQDRRIKSPSAMLRLIGQRGLTPKATGVFPELLMDQVVPGGGQSIVIAEDQIEELRKHRWSGANVVMERRRGKEAA